MIENTHLTAMIPARIGSQRLKKKNLVLLNGEPMIGWVINAAKEANVFDRIVVNSEDDIFEEIAESYGVEFYKRPKELGSNSTKSDYVVEDFMNNYKTDIVAWVNPTSPLQPPSEIEEVMRHFVSHKLDSLITTRKIQFHCNYKGKPLNYSISEEFAKTQDLEPVEHLVYSIMAWRKKTFLAEFRKKGAAILFGNIGFFPVSLKSSFMVKYEDDIRFIQYFVTGMKKNENSELEYYTS